jgi:hypothetical protein
MTLGTRQSKQDDKNSQKHTRQELETNRSRHGGAAKQAVPTAVNDASRRKNAGWKGQGKYLQGSRKR